MTVRIEEDHPSFVLLGGFDPGRFHPQWLRAEKLLGASEAEQAEIGVVSPAVTDWSTEWLHCQVTEDRLFLQATVESRGESLRDLVLSLLQLFEHARVRAMGMNRSMHFDVGGEQNWHRVGDALVPKTLWQPFLPKRAGLRTLQIEDPRDDGWPGKLFVTVQPSGKYKHAVFFDVNNEILSEQPEGASTTEPFARAIRERWPQLMIEAKAMAEGILEQALR